MNWGAPGEDGIWNQRAAKGPGPRKRIMSQCHDICEPMAWQAATPEARIVSQCHDLYRDPDVDRPEEGEQAEVAETVPPQLARV
jgi:hypothetical protein